MRRRRLPRRRSRRRRPPSARRSRQAAGAYTVNEVLDPAPTGGRGVEAGKRLVAIDITQTGIADGDSYNTFDFFVQDADGYVYGTGFGYTGVEPRIGSGELAAGQRGAGMGDHPGAGIGRAGVGPCRG